MTMKEQERRALEQIRQIVAGLGEDSYIGAAFEGCFEVAEENIENDFACSMMQRAKSAEQKVAELQSKMTLLTTAVKERETTIRLYEGRISEMNRKLAGAQDQLEGHKKALDEGTKEYAAARSRAEKAEAKIQQKDGEIVRLKAKLYDLMVK